MNDLERRADGAPRQLEHLSALIDGEIEDDAADHCCAHWREQAEARRHWHAWHLLGDVLRSEELACGATRSAHFLERVRGRLAASQLFRAQHVADQVPGMPVPARFGLLAPVRTAMIGGVVFEFAVDQCRQVFELPWGAVGAAFGVVHGFVGSNGQGKALPRGPTTARRRAYRAAAAAGWRAIRARGKCATAPCRSDSS